jgi:hypothetical protein
MSGGADKGKHRHDQLNERVEDAQRERPRLQEQLRDYRERRRRYEAQRGTTPAADGYRLRRGVRRDYSV